jgi:hypothetical protein
VGVRLVSFTGTDDLARLLNRTKLRGFTGLVGTAAYRQINGGGVALQRQL